MKSDSWSAPLGDDHHQLKHGVQPNNIHWLLHLWDLVGQRHFFQGVWLGWLTFWVLFWRGGLLRWAAWMLLCSSDSDIVDEVSLVKRALLPCELKLDERPQRGFLAMTERGAEVPSAYPIEVLGMLTKRGNPHSSRLPIRGQAIFVGLVLACPRMGEWG